MTFYRRYRSQNKSVLLKLFGLDTLRRILVRLFRKSEVTVNLFDALPQEVVLQVRDRHS